MLETRRHLVKTRANGLCEYCQTSQMVVIEMQIDHIIPVSKGGNQDLDNLCYACPRCNRHKADSITGIDTNTHQEVRLFHPRQDTWTEHFRWDATGTQLLGLTPQGRATIQRLRINDIDVQNSRQLWVKAGWHPPT